ncbi:MAG: ABC transporter substrate-binding protein [Holosporales bacterium]|nr:ABC transporter substrate-binding protein [Holosporales bacterium]
MNVLLRGFMVIALLFVCSCDERPSEQRIVFGTSADYPPFEFYKNGEITGFEIDLANAIARELGKIVKFKDMSFPSMFSSLQNGTIDVAVASITPTDERRELYDFTEPYHVSAIVLVYKQNERLNIKNLSGETIACQLGSTQERWVKEKLPQVKIISIDNVVRAAEFVKSGQVIGIVVDELVAVSLCNEHTELKYFVLAKPEDLSRNSCGTALAVKKGNAVMLNAMNTAIKKLTDNGEFLRIKEKWGIKDISSETETPNE